MELWMCPFISLRHHQDKLNSAQTHFAFRMA
jgi:hypothetical protein